MERDALLGPVQTLTEPHKSQITTGLLSKPSLLYSNEELNAQVAL